MGKVSEDLRPLFEQFKENFIARASVKNLLISQDELFRLFENEITASRALQITAAKELAKSVCQEVSQEFNAELSILRDTIREDVKNSVGGKVKTIIEAAKADWQKQRDGVINTLSSELTQELSVDKEGLRREIRQAQDATHIEACKEVNVIDGILPHKNGVIICNERTLHFPLPLVSGPGGKREVGGFCLFDPQFSVQEN